MSGPRLVLVLLLWRESGVSFLSQSCSEVDAKPIDLFRYIKIQPNTIDLITSLWGINPTNSVLKGATSRYFELFLPSTKLPLNSRKPENNTLQR